MLLGLTDAGADGDVGFLGASSAVSAVAAWYPPSDLASLPRDLGADAGAADTREAQLLGAPLSDVPELAREASPLTYADRAAVPILLRHGRADRLIPCGQSERLADALVAAGADVDFESYAGADHMWMGSPAAAADALEVTIRFLADRLIRPGSVRRP